MEKQLLNLGLRLEGMYVTMEIFRQPRTSDSPLFILRKIAHTASCTWVYQKKSELMREKKRRECWFVLHYITLRENEQHRTEICVPETSLRAVGLSNWAADRITLQCHLALTTRAWHPSSGLVASWALATAQWNSCKQNPKRSLMFNNNLYLNYVSYIPNHFFTKSIKT